MADDRRRNYRQPSITNFFARINDTPTASGSNKRATNSTKSSQSAAALPSDNWDELDARYRSSANGLKPSGMNGHVSHMEHSLPSTSSALEDDTAEEDESLVEALNLYEEQEAASGNESSMVVDSDEMEGTGLMEKDRENRVWRDWSGVDKAHLKGYFQPSDLVLPELCSSTRHAVMANLSRLPGTSASNSPYVDIWDYSHVRLPCSSRLRRTVRNAGRETVVTRWELISNNIIRDYKTIADLVPAISAYYTGIFNNSMIFGLTKLVKQDCTAHEANIFLSILLPFIAGLVIELPSECTQPIPLLKSGMNYTVTFSQRQIATILANAFFCTFPPQKTGEGKDLPGFPLINFDWLFSAPRVSREKRYQAKSQKLKCIMNYFYQVSQSNPAGLVSFTRRGLDVFPNWMESRTLLSKVHITHKGTIEDDGVGFLQVDFANKFVGGGVLREGCVQEEIRFVINPELIASCLFTECLQAKECLVVTGTQRFSNYAGYGDSFKFSDPHVDITPSDSWGRRMTRIVAIDAYKFGKSEEQYKPELLTRELDKAYVGFCHSDDEMASGGLAAVATGNWGCGAFRGEPRLKFLLQWLACSETGRDMVYFTFGDGRLQEELGSMYDLIVAQNLAVGDIFQAVARYYPDVIVKVFNQKKRPSFYTFLSDKFQEH